MQVSPREKIADPQHMKAFAVERHRLPEDFVSFRALCGMQSSPIVFAPNRAIVWGPLQWQAPVETLSFSLRSLELSAQVRRPNSCASGIPAHLDASIRAPAETVECASRTAVEIVCGVDVNQSFSQPIKCIPFTLHKAPELTKLQAASYVGFR